MTSRRTVIAGGAGAAVLAALGYRAWDRGAFTAGEGPAYEAWQDWQGKGDAPGRRPLHAAILASSAHNTQPWLFEPHENSITVYADLRHNLGAADPFRRELYVSLGCVLANLKLGAIRQGFDAVLQGQQPGKLTPGLTGNVVKLVDVTLYLRPGQPRALIPLCDAIPKRHTNRGAYLPDRKIAREKLALFGPRPFFVTDPGARKEMGALIVEATERFIADPEMSADSARWFRTGRRDIARHRDGVTTDTAGLSPAVTAIAKLLPDQAPEDADKYWLDATKDVQVPTAPAFGVFFEADRLQVLAAESAGLDWQNTHLIATAYGLAAQPMNQPIEMMDRGLLLGRKNDYANAIRKIVGVQAGDPAFIFRLGYAERPALPSPRRRLEDVIRQSGFA